ncbi:hypothetical protein ACQEVI_23955 [Promicromonospora sp. CA-289599]|uniref:hypothetical protein n=1 Tax=Promicromonospora sp. CA-289599 TaxID=3240014 RepID=UPI003D8E57F1
MDLSGDGREAVERELQRASDRMRWQADTAKALAALFLAAACGIGGAAWQTVGSTPLSLAGALVLGASAVLALTTFAVDTRESPVVEEIVAAAMVSGSDVARYLFANAILSTQLNERYVRRTVLLGAFQALAAVSGAVLLALALLIGSVPNA